MVRVFALPILLSAALLFGVQPLFARLALPLLGGTPAVWNTAMVFFQTVLLLGYGYAHFLTRRIPLRWQWGIHLAVLLGAAVALPIALPEGWQPPGDRFPAWWLLGLMSVAVGLPFFAVSTTSPLLQEWFARTGHAEARDPYFLYVASNLGSLGSLLAYPLLIEPYALLAAQTKGWSWGYGLLIGLVAIAGAVAIRAGEKGPAAVEEKDGQAGIPRFILLRWVLYAAIPSSLMLSVTQYLTTDIASAPLLWLPPLALYLLSFINAFARRPWISDWLLARAVPMVAIVLALLLVSRATDPKLLIVAVHLIAFFLLACLCHGRLAKERPPAWGLTAFYLAMSAGGVVGGAFTALLAPLVFSTVLEYPIVLAVALFFLPTRDGETPEPISRFRAIAWPAVTALLVAVALAAGNWVGGVNPALLLAPACFVCFLASKSPRLFAGCVVVFLATSLVGKRISDQTLETRRSFFGVYRVQRDESMGVIRLLQGTTVHGSQSVDPSKKREPTSYYYPEGPCGQVIAALQAGGPVKRVGVIGLGVGTLAAYAEAGSRWDFFEIDPASAYFARDAGHFSYLKDCRADWRIILGDGRLNLGRESDGAYDLLVIDAFSSDAIPIHLITREALELYVRKLAPQGVLLFHISNNHLNLRPVLAAAAKDFGVACRVRHHSASAENDDSRLGMSSTWALLGREEVALFRQIDPASWSVPVLPDGFRMWTDDYASLLSVWRRPE
jgi:hypothetical protein